MTPDTSILPPSFSFLEMAMDWQTLCKILDTRTLYHMQAGRQESKKARAECPTGTKNEKEKKEVRAEGPAGTKKREMCNQTEASANTGTEEKVLRVGDH